MLNENTRKIMCSALIQCHFDYCCSSWYSSTNKGQMKRLQVMQNKIIRFILNLRNRSHIGVAEHEKVNMFPVKDRARQLKLNHAFNVKMGQCPEYLKDKFNRIGDTELRVCTRASRNNFFLPRVKNQGVHTFYFSVIKDWNLLPAKIKDLTNRDHFRTSLREHILTELKNKEQCPYIFYN